MTLQWKFTSLEFLVLCEQYRAGSLPRPLLFQSDEEVMSDDLEQRKRLVWAELQPRLDSSFAGMAHVLRAPELYVLLQSWDERERTDRDKVLRVHVARAGALGFVFEQVPGELTFDSPMVVVTECDPRAMAVAVVQAMPDVGAGRLPDIPIVTDPVEHIAPSWSANSVWDDVESRPVYRTQRFFEQRADLTGVITVAQGRSKFGPRGLHETTLLWRDVADDGRYVMALDDSPVAVATSRQQLVYRIHRDIEHLLERIESHWEDGRPEDRY
ncbi:ESX secretion-associated protein EspG [Nocardia colli]|uniref:ESX secretion-associated protein EspG n=1 Tax=Nocardia colli TaxID=2545717 RepID=A0A5N0DRL7_9NOCA|nr:ESX secretion-associated protein EspG [Nocardia colli]KAA8879698.1 ESX secretion-associated protein EspG [Nocardia colli]